MNHQEKLAFKKAMREIGKSGGLATLDRYGKEQMAEWGKKGGRPKKPVVDKVLNT